MLSSKSLRLLRPCALAWYIAASASRISVAGSLPASG